jgi:hypothetical protein
VVVVAATAVIALARAPGAAADHDTVGGGTFAVYNSDGSCTDFVADSTPYTLCNSGWINLTVPAKYIIVPLGPHISVACNTYAPDGSLFEHDVENLAEVPDKQRFWAAHGWGPYTPQAMCQLW